MAAKKLLTMKVTPNQLNQYRKDADEFTGGNVSELFRRAVAAFKKQKKTKNPAPDISLKLYFALLRYVEFDSCECNEIPAPCAYCEANQVIELAKGAKK